MFESDITIDIYFSPGYLCKHVRNVGLPFLTHLYIGLLCVTLQILPKVYKLQCQAILTLVRPIDFILLSCNMLYHM
jgi:hypothetical protein